MGGVNMGDADSQNGSPPNTSTDHQNGSPSGTPPDPSGGSPRAPQETDRAEVEVVDGQKTVPIITPAIVYDSTGWVVDLPVDTIKDADSFVVPNGYRSDGARGRSCIRYSYCRFLLE